MAIKIHFSSTSDAGTPCMLAWAAAFVSAEEQAQRFAARRTVHFGRELARGFLEDWTAVSRPEDAQIIVHGLEYTGDDSCRQTARLASELGKPCLFFGENEDLPPSQLTYGFLYRHSIFEQQPNERSMPVFINDVKSEIRSQAALPIDWMVEPKVGFCGYVGSGVSRAIYRLAGATRKVEGLAIRSRILRSLRRDGAVNCAFIERSSYLGSATLAAFDRRHRLASARKEFLENLFDCPYNICVRGKGNHSVRFYETLAAGRIPLFVNTGCVLPLASEIDWRQHALWIEECEIPRIGELARLQHGAIGPERFAAMQRANRELWERYLRPLPFFRHVLSVAANEGRAP
jgi:hypothetical protein